MSEASDGSAAALGDARAPAQPRCRGVPAGCAAAVRGRPHRRWPRRAHAPPTSTSRPTSTSTRPSGSLASGRAGRRRHRGRGAAPQRPARRDRRPRPLLDLQAATPAISNAARYARIVQDTPLLRRLIGVAADIAELAYDEPDDVVKVLDEAETKVFEIAEHRVSDRTMAIGDLLPLALERSRVPLRARHRRDRHAHRASPTSTSC